MSELLEDQPENVVQFLQKWIKINGGRYEENSKSYDGQLPTSDEDQEENMDSDEEAKMEAKMGTEAWKTTKKFAVSAEAYGEYN